MSFQTGLSGLSASSKSLDVIGNNIANANTVGMKYSRTEFSSLIAAQSASGRSSSGIGVGEGTIAQQFTQGNITISGNNLDVAINGNGFFQVTQVDGSTAYTRDGQFKLDSSGNLITNAGANVMGFPTDLLGVRTSLTPQQISLPTSAPIPAKATSEIVAAFNLDSRVTPAYQTSTPTLISTYGTPVTAFDSQGNEVPVSLYFVKTGPDLTSNPNTTVDTWDVFDANTVDAGTTALNANAAIFATDKANKAWNAINTDPADQKATFDAAGGTNYPDTQLSLVTTEALMQLEFDVNGDLYAVNVRDSSADSWTAVADMSAVGATLSSPNSAIGDFDVSLDLSEATQYGTSFSVSDLTQDGYTAGDLNGLSIDSKGIITTLYSNGETQSYGQLLLADFRNVQGLTQISGGNWVESFASGQPVIGSAGEGKFGALQSGALEDSNVDLTSELVKMMTAQRDYQANAQTIKTQDQVLSTLVNLR